MKNNAICYHETRPTARFRLFCFANAGGSAVLYREWASAFPPTIDICPVELPGRGLRLAEPRFTSLEPLVASLHQELEPYFDLPFAFLGHSMGGLLSYELTARLEKESQVHPELIFVSAHRAPHLPPTVADTYLLGDQHLLAKLKTLGGTPQKVLENDSLMEIMLPIVRDDFTVCDTYAFTSKPALNCPIIALAGLHDSHVTHAEMEAWQQHTQGHFALHVFPGDHFYINSARHLVQQIVFQTIRSSDTYWVGNQAKEGVTCGF